MTHLHYASWKSGAKMFAGLTSGISACGVRGVPRESLTPHRDDADCAACLAATDPDRRDADQEQI